MWILERHHPLGRLWYVRRTPSGQRSPVRNWVILLHYVQQLLCWYPLEPCKFPHMPVPPVEQGLRTVAQNVPCSRRPILSGCRGYLVYPSCCQFRPKIYSIHAAPEGKVVASRIVLPNSERRVSIYCSASKDEALRWVPVWISLVYRDSLRLTEINE